MDRLDQVLDSALPLLRRAEDVLELAGAPPGHAVWGHLRRVRLMPADAARAVAELRPAALAGAEPELRADARVCVEAAAALPPPGEWEGEAADTYDDQRVRTAAHLAGGDDSLDERFEATADLAAALFEWMTRTRGNLAAALTEILTSAEAFTLTSPSSFPPTPAETEAAANLTAHVLRTIAADYAEAEDLLEGSRHLADPIPL